MRPLLGDGWRRTAARCDVVWSEHPPSRETLLRGFRLTESGPVLVRPSLSVVTAAGGGLVLSELYIQVVAEAAADDDDFGPCPSAAIALLWWYYY